MSGTHEDISMLPHWLYFTNTTQSSYTPRTLAQVADLCENDLRLQKRKGRTLHEPRKLYLEYACAVFVYSSEGERQANALSSQGKYDPTNYF
jgi:hypothetical protein